MILENERGRQAIDDLPDRIKVCGFDIALVKWTHHQASGAARYGEFASIEQVIRLQRDMPTRFKAVDTLLHELGHAIYWAFNLHDDDKEERMVGTMATAWTGIFRDNPWLTKWIADAVAD